MFEQRVNSDVLTVSTVNSQDQVTQKPLRDSVKQALKNYFAQLNGQDVNVSCNYKYKPKWKIEV